MKKYKDFEKSKKNNILRFIKNGSVKGFRHKNNLPVRGQRTHSNAKTARNLEKINLYKLFIIFIKNIQAIYKKRKNVFIIIIFTFIKQFNLKYIRI